MKVALIAAIARNRVIGREGTLPWHLPDDLQRFKRLTTGHAIVMGRRTWESLGRPLRNRRNIVLSSSPVAGAEWYPSIADAFTALASQERVFVIGGGALFSQVLARADELYLTLVHRDVEGDAWFPPYEHLLGTTFIETRRESRGDIDFIDYVRRAD